MKKLAFIGAAIVVLFIIFFLTKGKKEQNLEREPPQVKMIKDSHSLSAKSAGRNAQMAQRHYYNLNGRYASSLSELLTVDKNIADDPSVTFRFMHASENGYTFQAMTTQAVETPLTFTD